MEQIMTCDLSRVQVCYRLHFVVVAEGGGGWWDWHLYVRIPIDRSSLQGVFFHLDTWTFFLSVWWMLVVVIASFVTQLCSWGNVNKEKIVGRTYDSFVGLWGDLLTRTHTRICAGTHTHAQSHTRMHTDTHACTHTHTRTHKNQSQIKLNKKKV